MRERRRGGYGWVLLAGLFAPFHAGCSVLSGFGLLPERQELIPDADRLRQVVGEGLPRELDAPPLGEYVVGSGDGLLVLPVNLDSPARLPSDQTVLPEDRKSVV